MHILQSVIIAFSMYSKIPMPQIKWNDKNMKYAICFFPMVGVIIGALLILWHSLASFLGLNEMIFAAVATAIPIFVTGGIHVDGFCDTVDALASYQSTERKLEILKDPNCGAFALIKAILYFIITFALYTQIDTVGIYIMATGFVLERALSGLCIVCFKKATGSGLVATFSEKSAKEKVAFVMCVYIIISMIAIIFIDLILAVIALLFVLISLIYYRLISYKHFNGITGDIAGYFLQICEISILVAVVISKVVLNLCN